MHADKKRDRYTYMGLFIKKKIYKKIYKKKISGRKLMKLSSNCLWEVRPGIWRWKRLIFLVCPFVMHEILVMCAYIIIFLKTGKKET